MRNPMPHLPTMPRSTDRVITGTAGGWADAYGIDPTVVRVALALLTFVAGLGAVMYGVMFAVSDPPDSVDPAGGAPTRNAPRRDHRRDLAIATATGAALMSARHLGV